MFHYGKVSTPSEPEKIQKMTESMISNPFPGIMFLIFLVLGILNITRSRKAKKESDSIQINYLKRLLWGDFWMVWGFLAVWTNGAEKAGILVWIGFFTLAWASIAKKKALGNQAKKEQEQAYQEQQRVYQEKENQEEARLR